jgi:hypothetical protein
LPLSIFFVAQVGAQEKEAKAAMLAALQRALATH